MEHALVNDIDTDIDIDIYTRVYASLRATRVYTRVRARARIRVNQCRLRILKRPRFETLPLSSTLDALSALSAETGRPESPVAVRARGSSLPNIDCHAGRFVPGVPLLSLPICSFLFSQRVGRRRTTDSPRRSIARRAEVSTLSRGISFSALLPLPIPFFTS